MYKEAVPYETPHLCPASGLLRLDRPRGPGGGYRLRSRVSGQLYLLLNGISPQHRRGGHPAGPVCAAVKNGEKYGVEDKMTFCLSNGAQDIPRNFDTLVCAGMGADVMISILSAAPWLQSDRYRLVLQCQSKTPVLRKYLSETGWHIRREQVLRDGRFLYTVMDCVWEPGRILTPGQCYLSPALLASGCPLLPEYIAWVRDHLALSVRSQGEQGRSL